MSPGTARRMRLSCPGRGGTAEPSLRSPPAKLRPADRTSTSRAPCLGQNLPEPIEFFGVVLGHVPGLAGVGVEVVELGRGVVARLVLGQVLLRSGGALDELPLPAPDRQ